MDLCRQRGWRTWLFPVGVDVRRFCSQSICRLMTAVWTTGREKRVDIQKLGQAAERASSWLGLDERRRAGSTNQHTVTDHHCGPIRYESVHGLKGQNTRWRRAPYWWCWLKSSPYMTVYTHDIFKRLNYMYWKMTETRFVDCLYPLQQYNYHLRTWW